MHGMCIGMGLSVKNIPLFRQLVVAGVAIIIAGLATYVAILVPRQRQMGEERGALVYETECAGCHGAKLEGQPDWHHVNAAGRLPAPPLDGTGHGWRHSNDELFHMVKFSVLDQAGPGYQTDMPAFDGKLTDDDIHAVLAFIHSHWPSGIQAAQSFLNPNHEGMPAHPDPDWRLPPDCDEPVRGKAPAP